MIDDNFRQRVNTIYVSLCYYNSRQYKVLLFQFATGITTYDDCYYNLRQVTLQYITFRELKHQRRRWPRKRHLKSGFALPQLYSAYSISKNLANVRWPIFVALNSKGLYQSLGKVQESCFFVCSHPRQNVKLGISTM